MSEVEQVSKEAGVEQIEEEIVRVPVKPGSLIDTRIPMDVNISPDGKRVAYDIFERVADRPRPRFRVWTVGTDGNEREPLTDRMRETYAPRWSPDGQSIAFIGKGEDEKAKPQVYVIPATSGEPKQICTMPNGVGGLAWSPDGKYLSFLSLQGEEPESDPIVVRPGRHMRLWKVRPDYDTPEPVTPDNQTVWEYTWSPDSTHIAMYYTAGPDETDWYNGQVGIVNSDGGAIRQLTHLTRQASALTWTPDSKNVTYISGEWSDRGLVGGEIFTVPTTGGEEHNLTPAATVSYSYCRWFPDGQNLLYACWSGVTHQLGILHTRDGGTTLLDDNFVMGEPQGPHFSATADLRSIAVTHSTSQQPYDVYVGHLSSENSTQQTVTWKQLTHLNSLTEEVMAIAPAQHIQYTSVDGWRIDALLTMPLKKSEKSKTPPLVVLVHGGPSSAWIDGWSITIQWTQTLAAAGFAVLCPNIRGSQGHGVAFSDAVLTDMGGKDFQDVLHGVDYLIEQELVDGNRVGIMGWSYGGFMTAWAISQTTRFKAAMVGAGVTDFHDFHAVSNIPDWDERILGASPFEQPDVYRAHSSITNAGRITTPTLILHGADDICVPVNQAYALYRALTERQVPTELVIYPREGHGPRERAHIIDLERRTLAWFKQYL